MGVRVFVITHHLLCVCSWAHNPTHPTRAAASSKLLQKWGMRARRTDTDAYTRQRKMLLLLAADRSCNHSAPHNLMPACHREEPASHAHTLLNS